VVGGAVVEGECDGVAIKAVLHAPNGLGVGDHVMVGAQIIDEPEELGELIVGDLVIAEDVERGAGTGKRADDLAAGASQQTGE
jgi:hypothetical protein